MGEEINYDAAFSSTELFRCIDGKDVYGSLRCIKRKDGIDKQCVLTGSTYLHVVTRVANPINETKYVPFVYQLSNADCNLDVRDKNGFTALQLSIRFSLLEIMVALLKCGAKTSTEYEEGLIARYGGPFANEFRSWYNKYSLGYWDAVENEKAFKVNVLVKSWCRVNIKKNGLTLIEFAKAKDAEDKIIRMLVQNEASIEFAHATIAGDEHRMKYLLCNQSVNLCTKDLSHKENFFDPYSPLSLYGVAIKYGHKHILHMLRNTEENGQCKVDDMNHIYKSRACVIL